MQQKDFPIAKFRIMARKTSGVVFECFTWTFNAQDGISRAWQDAKLFNQDLVEVWAEPVENAHVK